MNVLFVFINNGIRVRSYEGMTESAYTRIHKFSKAYFTLGGSWLSPMTVTSYLPIVSYVRY